MRETLLDDFRARCRAYYRQPQRDPHHKARRDVYRDLDSKHGREVVNRHVFRIAAILDATELEIACGGARDRLSGWQERRLG